MSKVSVLLPLYRPNLTYLREAIACLKAQTFRDFEAILFNQPWEETNVQEAIRNDIDDPRFHFVQSETLRGIGANWNACLPFATAPYIQYLFYDDLWEPTYLETMVATLERNPSAGFASANHSYRKEGNVPAAPFYDRLHEFVTKNIAPGLHERKQFLRWWLERGLRPNIIGEPSFVLLRRSLVENVGGFDESMVQFLDSEYWARCLLHADWVYVPEILGHFRVHPAGTSALNEHAGKGLFERLRTLETVLNALPRSEKKEARHAVVRALAEMIAKFFARKKEGKSLSVHGSRGAGIFFARHPVLTLRAGMLWLFDHRAVAS